MDSQLMRQQMTTFTDSSTKTFSRVVHTKEALEKIISLYGETKEVSALVKLYYQMIIDEYELLLIILNNLAEDSYIKELRSSKELDAGITRINKILNESIVDAKENLKLQKKKAPSYKTSNKKGGNSKNVTRGILHILGMI